MKINYVALAMSLGFIPTSLGFAKWTGIWYDRGFVMLSIMNGAFSIVFGLAFLVFFCFAFKE